MNIQLSLFGYNIPFEIKGPIEDQRGDFILTIEASMKVGLLRGLCWWIDEMLPLHHAQL